jgi:type IV secretion system protein VirD4
MAKNDYLYRQHVGERRFENRFATDEEMKSILFKSDMEADSIPLNHGGTPFVSDGKTAYVDAADNHTLILGSTGSMKTRVFVIPTIYSLAQAGEDMVISDPKGEIYDRTSGFLKKKGYDIRTINLRDMEHSDSWNPLLEAYRLAKNGDENTAMRMIQDFVGTLSNKLQEATAPMWGFLANQFITGSVLMLFRAAQSEEEVNVVSLLSFLYAAQSASDGLNPLAEVVQDINPVSPIRQMMDATQITASGTRAGVFANVSAAYHVFSSSPALQKLSAKDTFDIHALAKPSEKHVIFLIVPDEITTYHFFCSTFIKQLYDVLVGEASKLPSQSLPRRVNFLLDEFANMPRISDMPSMITAARSRNIRFFLVVQSDSQLRTMYGDDAKTIKTNCLNWVYLNSKEDTLIREVQDLVGTRRIDRGEIPLISYNELTSLKKVNEPGKSGAQALVMLTRSHPYLAFLPDFTRYQGFSGDAPFALPLTDLHYQVFDVKNRICSLNGETSKINAIFGPGVPMAGGCEKKAAPNPQAPKTDEVAPSNPDEIELPEGIDEETYRKLRGILSKKKAG